MNHMRVTTVLFLAIAAAGAQAQPRPLNQAPKGFTALFNGQDLTGWRGRQGTYSPYEQAKLTPAELTAKQTAWNAERDKHWSVDKAKGEIVSDGQSVHLATDKEYGDFEMWVDWLMVSPGGDSGLYLRSIPQVQIWDPANLKEQKNGADRGSGALWNNNKDNPGKWPLVKADNPIGEWNTFKIKMIGSRVWISLNDKVTVDGQVLDNFFDRTQPVPARGPIELQTHGSEIRFRNIYLREIGAAEAKAAEKRVVPGGVLHSYWYLIGVSGMADKAEVWQGTLALMVLKTLETLGPLHGYGIARRIEQTSGDKLSLNYGTLYPALLKLEQEGYVASEWGLSENNRKAKFYKLTRAGKKQVERETLEWERTTGILARFLSPERPS